MNLGFILVNNDFLGICRGYINFSKYSSSYNMPVSELIISGIVSGMNIAHRAGITERFCRWLTKKMSFSKVEAVIVEEHVRKQIHQTDLLKEQDSALIINLESMHLSSLTDQERAILKNMKLENYEFYLLSIGAMLKTLLNNLRQLHGNNNRLILILSSTTLADMLHIKVSSTYYSSKTFFDAIIETPRITDTEKQHLLSMRKKLMDAPNSKCFGSLEELVRLIGEKHDLTVMEDNKI